MKIFYCGLEPYNDRYTLQLTKWNTNVFDIKNIDYKVVEGQIKSSEIKTGQVLDAHGRTYYSLTQIANIVQMMYNGEIDSDSVIFFEDMFTPGIESIFYIMDQLPKDKKPKIFVRCLAQTIDPDDFVNKLNMTKWMKHFELMVASSVHGVLVASEEMIPFIRNAGWKSNIYVTGLPFGKDEVKSRVSIKEWKERKNRVVFASRLDEEKQPHFYLDLIKYYRQNIKSNVEFAILSGGNIKSNNPEVLKKILEAKESGELKIYDKLSKNEYYELLTDSKVLFNCALQDWVSNTISEADALETNVLFPAYRSFPETLFNCPNRLYIPWSIEDAAIKLHHLIYNQHKNVGKVSDYQDKTIERTINILSDKGEEYLRLGDYRNYIYPLKIKEK